MIVKIWMCAKCNAVYNEEIEYCDGEDCYSYGETTIEGLAMFPDKEN